MEQQRTIAEAGTKLEKAKLLPDLSFGYNNLSIRDGIDLNDSRRFSSIQAGIGIPVFSKAQRSRAGAAKVNEAIALTALEREKQSLNKQYLDALAQLKKNKADVNYFEGTGLKNAATIKQTLSRQLSTGEINYLEWTILNQQALTIESEYLDAVKSLNESIIQIEFLQFNTKL